MIRYLRKRWNSLYEVAGTPSPYQMPMVFRPLELIVILVGVLPAMAVMAMKASSVYYVFLILYFAFFGGFPYTWYCFIRGVRRDQADAG